MFFSWFDESSHSDGMQLCMSIRIRFFVYWISVDVCIYIIYVCFIIVTYISGGYCFNFDCRIFKCGGILVCP